MMIIARILFCNNSAFYSVANARIYDDSDNCRFTTDSRIKTYIYNPNEVYLLKCSITVFNLIEFGRGEAIETITLGESFV